MKRERVMRQLWDTSHGNDDGTHSVEFNYFYRWMMKVKQLVGCSRIGFSAGSVSTFHTFYAMSQRHTYLYFFTNTNLRFFAFIVLFLHAINHIFFRSKSIENCKNEHFQILTIPLQVHYILAWIRKQNNNRLILNVPPTQFSQTSLYLTIHVTCGYFYWRTTTLIFTHQQKQKKRANLNVIL